MILIVSDPELDAHISPVTEELGVRGEAFKIYDPASFPYDSHITVQHSRTGMHSFLTWDGTELDLSTVKSIWYRRPGKFNLSDKLLAQEKEWIRTECNHFVRGLWSHTHALWVSDPDAIRTASVKLLQLRVARELGFAIPHFIVTNKLSAAKEFIKSHPAGVIIKVLADPFLMYTDRAATFYTHLVTAADEELLDCVQYGPTFLQEFVEKTADIRVTVFGTEVFAVRIDSTHLQEARIDFRRAETYDLPHEVILLPDQLKAGCIDLVRSLGLHFGAIDLLLKPGGEYIFLEINPNGQWYWLEWVTGTPMTKALCDLLVLR